MHYLGVRDGKRKKKAKLNLSTLVLFTVIHLVVLIVYKKSVTLIDAELIRWKICWKERKRTNKETDKPSVPDSLLHSTTCHT